MNQKTSREGGHPRLHAVQAPEAPLAPTDLETHLARIEFAEALGRRAVQQDPELFEQSLVGRWRSLEHLVDDFITESGMAKGLNVLPIRLRPFVVIDRLRVAESLRQELLVLPVNDSVWVFDAPIGGEHGR